MPSAPLSFFPFALAFRLAPMRVGCLPSCESEPHSQAAQLQEEPPPRIIPAAFVQSVPVPK